MQLKVRLGNIDAETARRLAALIATYAADDLRITVNQGLLLKFVRPEYLPYLYSELDRLGLADPGFQTIADITACPGTDTCALGVTNSTGLARRLEQVIWEEYPGLVEESDIHIKISGCMNSCGQHMAANIGFHGSSIKQGAHIVPSMQVVMGGGVDPEGKGFVAERIIKLPTKRIPDALRALLDDYEANSAGGEYFNDYFYRQGKRYFYTLLKPLASTGDLVATDFMDWEQEHRYRQEIGVGECAGVTLDVVSTIINDAEEKASLAKEALEAGHYADSIYHSYTAFVIGAKALLLSIDVKCNTHRGILDDFQEHYVANGPFAFEPDFPAFVLRMKREAPAESFAVSYGADAAAFVRRVVVERRRQVEAEGGKDKLVVGSYYKA